MALKDSLLIANDNFGVKRPALPDAMNNRADAREIREFMESYLAVEDPAVREQIRNAVTEAAAASK